MTGENADVQKKLADEADKHKKVKEDLKSKHDEAQRIFSIQERKWREAIEARRKMDEFWEKDGVERGLYY